MARPLKLDIQESQAELKALLGKQKTAQGKERVQALYLLKGEHVDTITDLAERLGRHRVTVQKWLALYRQGGMAALLHHRPPSGRQSSIPTWAVESLKERLTEPQSFGSYYAVQQWLHESLGVRASYAAVYRLVHDKLRAKLKGAKR
ncbi:MAG: helix-turn-helix domain-containing protein [Leptolyngbya sp. SIO1E4]|nr:helix-turn-helix domain-containing protein [Leptolyngbya sp. SIO1E4]